MNIEAHKRNLEESTEAIKYCILKGIANHQRSIGFHTSAVMCDMLEMLLHKKSLIDPGTQIKHDWFASERIASESFPFDFPNKKDILKLMVHIESKRSVLCYGKQQAEEFIQDAVESFNALKAKLKEVGLDEI